MIYILQKARILQNFKDIFELIIIVLLLHHLVLDMIKSYVRGIKVFTCLEFKDKSIILSTNFFHLAIIHLFCNFISTTKHEMENRLQDTPKLNSDVMNILLDILKINPYCYFFQNLKNISKLIDHKICINSDPKLDQRVYNSPLASQVAAIWLDDNSSIEYHGLDIIYYYIFTF